MNPLRQLRALIPVIQEHVGTVPHVVVCSPLWEERVKFTVQDMQLIDWGVYVLPGAGDAIVVLSFEDFRNEFGGNNKTVSINTAVPVAPGSTPTPAPFDPRWYGL